MTVDVMGKHKPLFSDSQPVDYSIFSVHFEGDVRWTTHYWPGNLFDPLKVCKDA